MKFLTPGEALATIGERSKLITNAGVSFMTAILSGDADDETVEERLGLGGCLDCIHNVKTEERWDCELCLCPRTRLSELHRKARFEYDTCKAGNWKILRENRNKRSLTNGR